TKRPDTVGQPPSTEIGVPHMPSLKGPLAQQLFNLGLRDSRNVMEPVLRAVFNVLAFDHATIAHKGDLLNAKPGLDLRQLRSQSVRIGGIAGKHFDGDRMPVLIAE